MRSIRYILLSYIQQEFFNVLNISLGIIGLIFGIIDIFIDKEPFPSTWYRFLWVVLMIVPASAYHLKRLIQSDSGVLVPNYIKYQLITVSIIYIPLIIIPPLIAVSQGHSFLNYFAMMLISVSVLVWIRFIFNDPGFMVVLAIIPLWLIYELLDFEKNLSLVSSFKEITGIQSESFFPLILIILTFILIYHLLVSIFRKPVFGKTIEKEPTIDLFLYNHDKIDFFTSRIITNKLARLVNRIEDRKIPYFQKIRLFQYSLFNPESTLFLGTSAFIFTSIGILTGLLLFSIEEIPGIFFNNYTLPVFFLIYHISAGIISSDFFQHRNRMPYLWIQSRLRRKEFIKAVITTYLYVTLKQYIKTTVLFLFLLWVFKIDPAASIYQFLLLGFLFYMFIISFSMIVSEYNVSTNSFGWSIFHMIMIWPVFGINLFFMKYLNMSINSWIFISLFGLISGFLLWMGFRRFSETEMNFAGPGV